MEHSPYAPFKPSSEGPNPLRPYYRPSAIGNAPTATDAHVSSTAPKNSSNYGSSAREILSDLNYGDIIGGDGPSTTDNLRALLDQALWKYSSVFMAQPFEVAKMVLQVRLAGQAAAVTNDPASPMSRRQRGGRVWENLREEDEDEDENDEDDEMSYFTSAASSSTTTSPKVKSPSPTKLRDTPSRSQQRSRAAPKEPLYKLELRKNDSLMEVMAQLWTKEGAWGLWKGTNVTFLHSLLLKTIESWLRGMLSAMVNLPDPGVVVSSSGVGGLDVIDSPSPLSSLGIAVAAAGVAGLLLAPLDTVRTRVMVTSTTEPPRSIIPCLRLMPSWTCPSSLIAPTLLHSILPTFISTSTPLLLRANLRIDPIITPVSYSICTFLSSVTELFIKLPVETILRRGQIEYLSQQPPSKDPSTQQRGGRSRSSPQRNAHFTPATVVDVGPYTGVVSSMWRIVREEGSSLEKTTSSTRSVQGQPPKQPVYVARKGQGVQGLWRGWRVGLWGLVGVWGVAALGAGGEVKGGEF